MKIPLLPVLCIALSVLPARAAGAPAGPFPAALAACDVMWTTLGKDSADSMPLGNGDIGLNVWTEENGDILFYISKTDAWNEDGNLVKIGRVRVALSPNPFTPGTAFSQALRLQDGAVEITGGAGPTKIVVRVWVDANYPVVRLESTSAQPVSMKVTLDPWRTAPDGKVSADVVVPDDKNAVIWYHHNTKSRNPHLDNITFGALMKGDGFVRGEGNTLQSAKPSTAQLISVYPMTATVADVAEWRASLDKLVAATAPLDAAKCWAEHKAWWRQFWNRSWLFIQGDANAEKVTQGSVLQRFVTACAGRGAYPIKFNGSIFTADNPAEGKGKDKVTGHNIVEPVNADFRAWGGQYWFQNTRPMYWPRLAAGDFDMMKPLFTMYANKLPDSLAFVKATYGHDGAYFAETSPFWAQLPAIKPTDKGNYTLRYFTPILELTAMMLDYHAYTGDDAFASETLLPVAKAGLTFFSQHFPRDPQGKLLLENDNSIEMFWDVTNPLPDIAGLHYVLGRLLELPPALVDGATRNEWKKLQSILPPVPIGEKDGKPVLLPYAGEQTAKSHNSENPELYALYPFRLYGVGKPGLDLARNAFDIRLNKRTGCWHQDVVHAPMLGLTDLAKKDVTTNFTSFDKRLRFPAFWARGHDYMPDQDNGGHGELGLQKMLAQCDGRKILLLPAWPKEWNADFKFAAPFNTTVEGCVENGVVTRLEVTPASRRKDVEVMPPFKLPASTLVAGGRLSGFKPTDSHTLCITFRGSQVTASLHEQILASGKAQGSARDLAFLASSYGPNLFDNPSVFPSRH